MQPKDPDLLIMYLKWALSDLGVSIRGERQTPGLPNGLPKRLVEAIESFGRRRASEFDKQHAMQIMQQVEKEGVRGEDRYIETALRLWHGNDKTVEPEDREVRLIRSWWGTERRESVWVDEDRATRRRGRPKKRTT